MEALLPDIQQRIKELQSEKADLENMRQEMKAALSVMSGAFAMPQEQQADTDDISHMVRSLVLNPLRVTLSMLEGLSEKIRSLSFVHSKRLRFLKY